ncbi:M23 family metallopeptidase [Saccharomonospora glauca]|uniref:Metalloendopeptidase-like membrane protein n=1 Tax=Saccharomonospora glauca K62 TaxID=928724 RepID=I1CXT1_9PSEU|nr:M23 family metallopeptidase [Saccharomonospora glauca]EIE97505.1 metalloendopeptidase-like membrane protein [Saccharomonospora glauca K62]
MVAAVAAGAFAAAAAGQTLQATSGGDSPEHRTDITPLANADDASAAMTTGGGAGVGGNTRVGAPVLLQVSENTTDGSVEAKKLTESAELTEARLEREAEERRKAAEEAARPKFVLPAQGVFTSGYGARWGATHYGIDIANSIGTPIVAAADGTVIDAGPASGFGLWVRIQLDDGTIHVYGHMDSFSVYVGQRVKAGEQIAVIGNRGQSTGPHLHFEVHENGQKVDPQAWLAARGVYI